MIAYIQGQITNIANEDRFDIVEVLTTSGVGYEICVPKGYMINISDKVSLFTSFQVREDSQTLYGFVSREEKEMFLMLITVSGVGPKTGISIMSKYSVGQLVTLIQKEDHKTLSSVSGLGSKTAQKVIVELKGKVDKMSGDSVEEDHNDGVISQLKSALKALGFGTQEIKDACEKAKVLLVSEKYGVEDLIKISLSRDND